MQEYFGLPWVVGLDLSSSDTDMSHLAPAVAVKRLDPPEDAVDPNDPEADPTSYYLCLMDDNRHNLQPCSCYWQMLSSIIYY